MARTGVAGQPKTPGTPSETRGPQIANEDSLRHTRWSTCPTPTSIRQLARVNLGGARGFRCGTGDRGYLPNGVGQPGSGAVDLRGLGARRLELGRVGAPRDRVRDTRWALARQLERVVRHGRGHA